jgi:hypothetical protein
MVVVSMKCDVHDLADVNGQSKLLGELSAKRLSGIFVQGHFSARKLP